MAVHPQKPSQLANNFDYCKDSRTVVVPQHKPLNPGTHKGVVEQAGLTLEEFVAEL